MRDAIAFVLGNFTLTFFVLGLTHRPLPCGTRISHATRQ